MKRRSIELFAVACAIALSLAACARAPSARDGAATGSAQTSASPTPVAGQALPLAVVHKTPTCGCCGDWIDHLRDAGFVVEVRDADDLTPVKQRLGVPYGKGSCHTAEIGGYFVEGHVPADDIKRLLAEAPKARGLVLPGMPIGSPGMEAPDGTVQPYTVELVTRDGSTVAYATHGP